MSTAKRQFGAIDKLPSGRWRARYRDAAGRRVTAANTFRTKADDSASLAVGQADLVRGHYIDPREGKTTVASWAQSWLGRPGKRAATVARDRQGIGVFLPMLADLSLAVLTPRHVQEAIDERSRHAEPATVAR